MHGASSAAHLVSARMLADMSSVLDEDVASSKVPFISCTQH